MTSLVDHLPPTRELGRPELRKFGLTMGLTFPILFGLVLPWIFSFRIPLWPFVLGGAFAVAGLAVPKVLAPVHRGWMWVAEKIGWFNTRVILGALFYLIFTPVGLLRRLIGSDPLALRRKGETTYRKPSVRRSANSLERPY